LREYPRQLIEARGERRVITTLPRVIAKLLAATDEMANFGRCGWRFGQFGNLRQQAVGDGNEIEFLLRWRKRRRIDLASVDWAALNVSDCGRALFGAAAANRFFPGYAAAPGVPLRAVGLRRDSRSEDHCTDTANQPEATGSEFHRTPSQIENHVGDLPKRGSKSTPYFLAALRARWNVCS
jgi:hypothetical protein